MITTANNTPENLRATTHLVQTSRFATRFANLLMIGLAVVSCAMFVLPWQQTSRGSGRVVAFDPQERQQTIQSPVKGVIERMADGLMEGSQVKQGDFILEIQPVAANQMEQVEAQTRDLNTKLESALAKIEALDENVRGFTEAGEFAVGAAEELVEAARAKLDAKEQLVAAYEAKQLQANLNYDRQQSLFESGIKPAREMETLKKELDVARAELRSVLGDVDSLQKELSAKESEREEKRRIAKTKIDYARATQQDAIGSAATIRKEIRELEMKQAELGRFRVTATRDGTIFRMPLFERGQAIKEGESIVTIVPETSRIAVELQIYGNDMPLLSKGQEVRLQFEGWPAVQFAGWPSVAVGTFSGTVATLDATDTSVGSFRILVVPNEEAEPWPSSRYLRQGVRVHGWVMLRRVSLGYEIWRQLNGFPVIISIDEPPDAKSKPPKIPK